MPIELKPHNEEAYEKVVKKFNETDRVAVVHPTGTGKMFIALKWLEENKGKKAIYLAPTNAILHDVKKNIFDSGMTMKDFPHLKRITYQKLAAMTDEELEALDADMIVTDEYHHCGGPEWGRGVRRLIDRNKGAKILGLSATPLRYFDGLRDMTDEMFGNNVASEMTLEEAISRGIIPEAIYVSSMYGYSQELGSMRERIENIKDNNKKKEAQSLLEGLKQKLDEQSKSIVELFTKYMKNTTGKYIIFCRNIEDMKKRMGQAQEMFGGVNSNITIRAVSSKIKESDRILTQFEDDHDEGTLKLLFAVNMLKEGYHVKDLDGVIMMRPTYSPTIFTQEIGRALSVGGGKVPVILDLVNNFDSCRIIEDFAERMKQYKGNVGSGRSRELRRGSITIFDHTREIREIAEKIMDLAAPKDVSLEEKIRIFEEFAQNEEELVGNTVFKGYPIGQWAIQIRSYIKTKNKVAINPTPDQFDRLTKLGILERQIDATIDEKIDILVEWVKKYPKATIVPKVSSDELAQYAEREEELQQLVSEYEQVQRYYDYVRVRKSQGKLNEGQIKKCIDGKIGGVFGKNQIEVDVQDFERLYGIDSDTAKLIIKRYGSIDAFRSAYIKAMVSQNVDKVIDKAILNKVDLVRGFDLSSPNFIVRNKNIANLIFDLFGENVLFMNYDGLEDAVVKTINDTGFSDNERIVLLSKYGLNGETPQTVPQIAKKLDRSRARVDQLCAKGIRLLRHPGRVKKIGIYDKRIVVDYDIQKKIIEEIFKYIDIFESRQPDHMDEDVRMKLTKMIMEGVVQTKKRSILLNFIQENMSLDQKVELLKMRFGDSVRITDFSVVRPSGKEAIIFGGNDSIRISKESYEKSMKFYSDIFLKECLSSQECQGKVVALMLENESDKPIMEYGSRAEIVDFINNNGLYSEDRKKELIEMYNKKMKEKAKNKIIEEIGRLEPRMYRGGGDTPIEELDLSVRSYNCLWKSGIRTIDDLVSNSEQDLKCMRNLGARSYFEIIGKLESYGYRLEDGHFSVIDANRGAYLDNQIDSSVVSQIQEEIDSSEDLDDDDKKALHSMLTRQICKCVGTKQEKQFEKLREEIVDSDKTKKQESVYTTIEDLDFSIRTFNCLKKSGINIVLDIIERGSDIHKIRNLGRKGVEEIVDKMRCLGFMVNGEHMDNMQSSENTGEKVRALEERINSNKFISKEQKAELMELLHETFGIIEIDSQGEGEKTEDKTALVDHILGQQQTIAEQRKELDKLATQKKEAPNEE